ncbi:MaoC/PaaZ C-terminal domain-containing protein [Rhodococcus wratislaviensis]|uniref:MaoC/PaaZ C-terminal domain-containing protein n=1 Tax=Rhodococcus wratislaviensis TaxID=44752 RepID=UPI0036536358
MALRSSAVKVGDAQSAVVIENLTRSQIVMYAGASGDYNPLHTDEVYAREVGGFPTVFAHGMLTMGATGRVLTDWLGDDRLLSYGVRFSGQVWPGDTLTTTATITAIRTESRGPVVDITVTTTNQDGVSVIRGTAVGLLDI